MSEEYFQLQAVTHLLLHLRTVHIGLTQNNGNEGTKCNDEPYFIVKIIWIKTRAYVTVVGAELHPNSITGWFW